MVERQYHVVGRRHGQQLLGTEGGVGERRYRFVQLAVRRACHLVIPPGGDRQQRVGIELPEQRGTRRELRSAPAIDVAAQARLQAFQDAGASLIEINPLISTPDGRVVALDAKLGVDDNELDRRPDIAALRDVTSEDPNEVEAREIYVDHPAGFKQPRTFYRIGGVEPSPLRPAPTLGEHTAEVEAVLPEPIEAGGASAPDAVPLPFEGVKILDLTAFWAGPVVTSTLGALGAEGALTFEREGIMDRRVERADDHAIWTITLQQPTTPPAEFGLRLVLPVPASQTDGVYIHTQRDSTTKLTQVVVLPPMFRVATRDAPGTW